MLTLTAVGLPLGILLAKMVLPKEIVLPAVVQMILNVLAWLLLFVWIPYRFAA